MTTSLLQKFVLTPVLLSATVFTILSVPLAMFGKQPVTIQLQEEPIFSGQLRDISTPYLGMAAVLSLGAGFAAVAVAGWRRSTYKSSLVEAQLLDLSKNLQQKETQLEALKLSDFQLQSSGLEAFVDDELPNEQTLAAVPANLAKELVNPLIITTTPSHAQATLSQLANAQAKPTLSVNSLPPNEMEELHTQLQQIMTSVQIALTATRTSMPSEALPAKTLPVTQSWVVKDTAF